MTRWSWLGLVGLGAFHGVNPAMGWLFAVALGLYRRSRGVVLLSLIPIAIGHALAVAVVAGAVLGLGLVIDAGAVRIASGAALIGWALYRALLGGRHRARFGMRVGMAGLAAWSFVMATTHGAGLMLAPFLIPAAAEHGAMAAHAGHAPAGAPIAAALAAVGVHTLAMLIVTGAVAVGVYEWLGVAFLRRGWINMDRLWTFALLATGLLLLATSAH